MQDLIQGLRATRDLGVNLSALNSFRQGLRQSPAYLKEVLSLSPSLQELHQIWDTQLNVRDHGISVTLLLLLADILSLSAQNEGVVSPETGHTLAMSLLDRRLKPMYFMLSSDSKGRSNAALILLTALAKFSEEAATQLSQTFDFSLSALPKLARPPKASKKTENSADSIAKQWQEKDVLKKPTRVAYVHFALAMLCSVDRLSLAMLVNNRIFMGGLMHHLASDPIQLRTEVFQALQRQVLASGSRKGGLSPADRAAIFTEATFAQLTLLVNFESDDRVVAKDILMQAATNPSYGLLPSTLKGGGTLIEAVTQQLSYGQRRLLKWLGTLKPFNCAAHGELLLHCCASSPALAVQMLLALPFHQHLEPSGTGKWLALASVVEKLMQTVIDSYKGRVCPHERQNFDITHSRLVLRCLLPSGLTRAALSRGTQHSNAAVRYSTLCLICRAFEAIGLLLAEMTDEDAATYIRTTLKNWLPDPQTVLLNLTSINSSLQDMNHLLLAVSLRALVGWQRVLPAALIESNIDVSKIVLAVDLQTFNPHIQLLLLSLLHSTLIQDGPPLLISNTGQLIPALKVLVHPTTTSAVKKKAYEFLRHRLLATSAFESNPAEAAMWLLTLPIGVESTLHFFAEAVLQIMRRSHDFYELILSSGNTVTTYSVLAPCILRQAIRILPSTKMTSVNKRAIIAFVYQGLCSLIQMQFAEENAGLRGVLKGVIQDEAKRQKTSGVRLELPIEGYLLNQLELLHLMKNDDSNPKKKRKLEGLIESPLGDDDSNENEGTCSMGSNTVQDQLSQGFLRPSDILPYYLRQLEDEDSICAILEAAKQSSQEASMCAKQVSMAPAFFVSLMDGKEGIAVKILRVLGSFNISKENFSGIVHRVLSSFEDAVDAPMGNRHCPMIQALVPLLNPLACERVFRLTMSEMNADMLNVAAHLFYSLSQQSKHESFVKILSCCACTPPTCLDNVLLDCLEDPLILCCSRSSVIELVETALVRGFVATPSLARSKILPIILSSPELQSRLHWKSEIIPRVLKQIDGGSSNTYTIALLLPLCLEVFHHHMAGCVGAWAKRIPTLQLLLSAYFTNERKTAESVTPDAIQALEEYALPVLLAALKCQPLLDTEEDLFLMKLLPSKGWNVSHCDSVKFSAPTIQRAQLAAHLVQSEGNSTAHRILPFVCAFVETLLACWSEKRASTNTLETVLLGSLNHAIGDQVAALSVSERRSASFASIVTIVCVRFGKQVLRRKTTHHETIQTLRRFVAAFLPEEDQDGPIAQREVATSAWKLLQLTVSHSEFLPIMQNSSAMPIAPAADELQRPLASLLPLSVESCRGEVEDNLVTRKAMIKKEYIELVQSLLDVVALYGNDEEHNTNLIQFCRQWLAVTMAAYEGTLSDADVAVWSLAKCMNKIMSRATLALQGSSELLQLMEGAISEAYFTWGAAALLLFKNGDARGALSKVFIDPVRCGLTVVFFPEWRKLMDDSGSPEPLIEPSYSAAGYDPAFMLLVAWKSLTSRLYSPQRFVQLGLLSLCLRCLASGDTWMRGLAYENVALYQDQLLETDFREKQQIALLLNALRAAIEKPFQRVPSVLAVFMAEAVTLAFNPGTPLYTSVNKYILRNYALDFSEIPLFGQFKLSGSQFAREERCWLLQLLAAGLRNSDDARIYRRKHVFKLVMSLYTALPVDSCSKELSVQLLNCAGKSPRAAGEIVETAGGFAWLSHNVMESLESGDIPMARALLSIMVQFTKLRTVMRNPGAYLGVAHDITFAAQIVLAGISRGGGGGGGGEEEFVTMVFEALELVLIAIKHGKQESVVPPVDITQLLGLTRDFQKDKQVYNALRNIYSELLE